MPPAGEQPERLEGHQVLRPQPHPAPEEAGPEGKCCLGLLEKNVAEDSYHHVKTTSSHNGEEVLGLWGAASLFPRLSWVLCLKLNSENGGVAPVKDRQIQCLGCPVAVFKRLDKLSFDV